MNPTPLTIDVKGLAEASAAAMHIRNGIADRRQLHAAMAVDVLQGSQFYISQSNRHATS